MKPARYGGSFIGLGGAVVFFLLLGVASPVHAGAVITRDGRTFNGALRLEGTNIVVTATAGEAVRIPVRSVARAVFSEARPAAGAERRAKRTWEEAKEKLPKVSSGNLEAEYFSEREMKHRRLFRREESINYEWPGNMPPAESVASHFTVRWTGRLLVPTPSGSACSNTLVLKFDGGVRLWLDGQLVLDAWDKPQAGRTLEVPFLAGRVCDFRLEYCRLQADACASVERWTFDHERVKPLRPGYFLPPRDAGAPPQAEFLQPWDGAVLRRPASLTLEAGVVGGSNAVQRVSFFEGGQFLAEVTNAPFRFTLQEPAPGVHTFTARVTDARQAVFASRPIQVQIADTGRGTLPEPWGDLAVGLPRSQVRVDFKNGTLALTAAGGDWRGQTDAFGCVFQRIEGDFDFIARLASFTEAAPEAQPLAGLCISGDFRPVAARAALLSGPDGGTALFSRALSSRVPETSPKRAPLPLWMRLVRHEDVVQTFTSSDGLKWTKAGLARLALLDTASVGLAAGTRSSKAAATAVFDHIVLSPGAPPSDSETQGVLLMSGSFLGEDLVPLRQVSVEGETAELRLMGRDKRETVPARYVARVV